MFKFVIKIFKQVYPLKLITSTDFLDKTARPTYSPLLFFQRPTSIKPLVSLRIRVDPHTFH